MKNLPVGTDFVHADRQTRTQEQTNSRFLQFYEKRSKIISKYSARCSGRQLKCVSCRTIHRHLLSVSCVQMWPFVYHFAGATASEWGKPLRERASESDLPFVYKLTVKPEDILKVKHTIENRAVNSKYRMQLSFTLQYVVNEVTSDLRKVVGIHSTFTELRPLQFLQEPSVCHKFVFIIRSATLMSILTERCSDQWLKNYNKFLTRIHVQTKWLYESHSFWRR
jgi:hypothetical protein